MHVRRVNNYVYTLYVSVFLLPMLSNTVVTLTSSMMSQSLYPFRALNYYFYQAACSSISITMRPDGQNCVCVEVQQRQNLIWNV